MSWILFGLSALVAVATFNALWPVRRPWWLKLPSFNAGWFANELPVHVLAGHAVVVVVLAGLGALDDRPGQVGVALSVAAAVGLVVLAAAHQRAGNAIDEALRRSIGPGGPVIADGDGEDRSAGAAVMAGLAVVGLVSRAGSGAGRRRRLLDRRWAESRARRVPAGGTPARLPGARRDPWGRMDRRGPPPRSATADGPHGGARMGVRQRRLPGRQNGDMARPDHRRQLGVGVGPRTHLGVRRRSRLRCRHRRLGRRTPRRPRRPHARRRRLPAAVGHGCAHPGVRAVLWPVRLRQQSRPAPAWGDAPRRAVRRQGAPR